MVFNIAEEAATSIFTIQVTEVRMWVVCTGTVARWKGKHDRSYRREQRRITLKKITLNTGPEQTISEEGTQSAYLEQPLYEVLQNQVPCRASIMRPTLWSTLNNSSSTSFLKTCSFRTFLKNYCTSKPPLTCPVISWPCNDVSLWD